MTQMTETNHSEIESLEEYAQYRALSIPAVLSLMLGMFSLLAIAITALLFVPLIGLVLGIVTTRRLRDRTHEFSGRGLAITGTILSCIALVVGIGVSTWTYATEVPEGYQRITFNDLQKDDMRPDLPFRESALQLDGKRVFVKGYVLSSEKRSDLSSFILVPDLGTCCFGSQPKLNDMIEVKLKPPLKTGFTYFRRKLAGTMTVDQRYKRADGVDGGHFKLEVDYLR